MAHRTIDIHSENRTLGDGARKIFVPGLVLGVAGLAIAAGIGFFGGGEHGLDRFFQSYLATFMFFLAITLGSLFFVIIHHLTRAGWSTVVRRIAEGLSTNSVVMLLLFAPLVYALMSPDIDLWPWADPAVTDHASPRYDAVIDGKSGYLNVPFFLVRAGIYFLVWIGLSRYFYRLSVQQDSTGDVELSLRMMATSAPSIIAFALTLTFAAFDWLMSQDPHWFSTIFGVYYFADCVGSFLALTILIVYFTQRSGRLTHAITTEHYHDLGKLLFAFSIVFWAYIAYSQYMLQWYGNIPEETAWWQARASGHPSAIEYQGKEFVPGAWSGWSMFLLVGHFAVPFVLIISRIPKRRAGMLAIAAAWMLFMIWYDLFWLITPVFWPENAPLDVLPLFPMLEALLLVGFAGIYIAMFAARLRNVSLVPERDPRLNESLAFENL
jgi:hypothetical protein